MKIFIKRQIANNIEQQKTKFPIIALTGPRRSGKTTLLKELFDSYRYVSLENPDLRSFATEDPVIQGIVDESEKMGQFILPGSQNFHLLKSITQTLAGRVALNSLFWFYAIFVCFIQF